jgi:hypothetical protein
MKYEGKERREIACGVCEFCRTEVISRLSIVETLTKEILEKHIPAMQSQLNSITSRVYANNKPSWSVLVMITFLTSTCVALLVQLLK